MHANFLLMQMSVLPYVIIDVIEAVVSLKRLANFLLEPELQTDAAFFDGTCH